MKFAHSVFYLLLFVFIDFTSLAQSSNNIISGPMLGQVELRSAKIWVEVKPGTPVELWYWKKGSLTTARRLSESPNPKAWFAPITFDLVALDMNTTY
jgi:alkaline phosphatase D